MNLGFFLQISHILGIFLHFFWRSDLQYPGSPSLEAFAFHRNKANCAYFKIFVQRAATLLSTYAYVQSI